ncbi:hypothetical protein [Variovorax sp. KK3]|uniref:hypothetical protein n=1 Tax=Variovorax sp. KK3 TaxID=1855728 RepID=UPI0015C2E733|nr:hypothetical protein [Variovorax sp. KK3]
MGTSTLVAMHGATGASHLSPRPPGRECEQRPRRVSYRIPESGFIPRAPTRKGPTSPEELVSDIPTDRLIVGARNDDEDISDDQVQASQAQPRSSQAFGMDLSALRDRRQAGALRFHGHYAHARERQRREEHSPRYQKQIKSFVDADGRECHEDQWIRAGKTRVERVQQSSTAFGKKAQGAFNELSRLLHGLAGRPRTTGSGYGGPEGVDTLLSIAKLTPVSGVAASVGTARLAGMAVGADALREGDAGAAHAAFAAVNGLGVLAVGPLVLDAMDCADGAIAVASSRAQAKANLRHCEDARRFLMHLDQATPDEAQAYLLFESAAAKLIDPTREQRAQANAVMLEGAKGAIVQPVGTSLAVGIQMAGYAGAAIPAPAGAALAPFGFASGTLDILQGRQEQIRRIDQNATAQRRKLGMTRVLLETPKAHPQHALLRGVVHGLQIRQDRLVRQAEREEIFAGIRIFSGSTRIASTAAGLVGLGLVAGGVLTAATGGIVAAVAAVPAAFVGGAFVLRNYRRAKSEHKDKWLRRAVGALALATSRETWEAKLAGSHPDGRTLRAEFQEGEYLPEDGRFAGTREMAFDVRDNEYAALLALAWQVQDLVRDGNHDPESPFMKLLDVFGVDALQLLAICKVASAKPASAQLDFIQAQLATALGMKFPLVAGAQPKPHVSVFIGHFQDAWSEVAQGLDHEPGSSAFLSKLHDVLAARFLGEPATMQAFCQSIDAFLDKTRNMPSSPLARQLGQFSRWSAMRWTGAPA